MRGWFAPYVLQARRRLGARGVQRQRDGALIRIEDAMGRLGYGDVHPWTELGDAPLAAQITAVSAILDGGEGTVLARRSVACALADGEARGEGRSLFAAPGEVLSTNHFLISGDPGDALDEVAERFSKGWTVFKLKVGVDPAAEADAIGRMHRRLGTGATLRLDAGASMSLETCSLFLDQLGDAAGTVDFLEDPVPYAGDLWKQLNARHRMTLASDREPADGLGEGFGVVVIKPAVQDPAKIVEAASSRGLRVVPTSYLDHPVGQLHGAAGFAAALAGAGMKKEGETWGMLSHHAYETTPYAEIFPCQGPLLRPPSDPGIGFGPLLQKENWRPLP